MGGQICSFHGSYQQLQNEIKEMEEIKKFLVRYSLLHEKFKILKQYFPYPAFQNVIKIRNSIVFRCSLNLHLSKDTGNQYFSGIIFQENNENLNNTNVQKAWIYQGQIKGENIKQGKGYSIFDNGDIYQGNWLENEFHGYGKYYSHQNIFYQGQFKNSKKQGFGKMIIRHPKKIQYKGQFQNNEMNGKGKILYQNDEKYQGQIINGLQDGFGIFQTPFMRYQGTWKEGLMEGQGKCVWFSNKGEIVSSYIGQYYKGKKHGFGQYNIENGKVFKGHWFEGKINKNTSSYILK